MKPASFLCVLMFVLLAASGCGDDKVCENFDVPTAQVCEGNGDCGDVNCEQLCASDLSDARGGAFCDEVCQCPCSVCVGVGIN